ncbi:hypothetical protein nbrc107696_19620 [Gordonia spumicola]|uniref:Uncharacterized protein n=2 Tax=Gordonia spumicola TaxID=589161 RepID=A0A7I9V804_9ACTN|nr:hypothetical protein nbrc107696_19620 [Gordonia spumicola]
MVKSRAMMSALAVVVATVGVSTPTAGTATAAPHSFARVMNDSKNGVAIEIDNRGTGLAEQRCTALIWRGDHVDELKRNLSFPTSLLNTSGKLVDAPMSGRRDFLDAKENSVAKGFFWATDADGDTKTDLSIIVNAPDDRPYRAPLSDYTGLVRCSNADGGTDGALGDAVFTLDLHPFDTWVTAQTLESSWGSLEGLGGSLGG